MMQIFSFGENLIVGVTPFSRRDSFLLIPIDHGYSLPDRFELNDLSWCWLTWKQAKEQWDPSLVT